MRQRIEGCYRDRAKLLKKNDQKAQTLQTIFDEIPPAARVLIYGDDLHHLDEIGQELDHMGKYYFKYTGELDAQKERPTILKEFRQGIRKILLAVGCLDEGIDIPACDVAVFISLRPPNVSLFNVEVVFFVSPLEKHLPGFTTIWFILSFLPEPMMMSAVWHCP